MTAHTATLSATDGPHDVPLYESDGWGTRGEAVGQVMDHVRKNFPEAVFIWDDEDGVHYVYDTANHHDNRDASAYIEVEESD